ncbi:uncharacterized protein LOC113347904 [Papaver somniferum]|uniref:uncharacterized protein LOC113347904 n=1 Tax=Papaver somniferum TaxID=3469 RepID=UPI000E6F9F68|nr:uncharacterized protein LOC113347904 [Papaver somniferum]
MKSPIQGRPLCLYTAFSDTAVGDLLAQEDDEGIEHPIYYFNRTLRNAELRYPKAEKSCLSIIHSIHKFRHYLLSNKVVLISKSDHAKFLLSKPVLMGKSAKWILQMSELDITCVSPRAIKGQAVADLLAAFPGEGTTALREDLPGEFPDISVVEEEAWILYFDGSAAPSNNTGGAGVVLMSPTGEVSSADAILPAEIKIPSARIAAASGVHWNEAEALSSRIAELDTLDSRRGKAEERAQVYINKISRAYDKTAYSTVYYKIVKVDGGKLEAVINGKWPKAYNA